MSKQSWGAWAASILTPPGLEEDQSIEENENKPINEQAAIDRGTIQDVPNNNSNEEKEGWLEYLAGEKFIGDIYAKSQGAVGFLKTDLSEFGSTVKKDTSSLLQTTSKTLQKTLNVSDESMDTFKSDMKYVLGGIQSTITCLADNASAVAFSGEKDSPSTEILYDPLTTKIDELRSSQSTYIENVPDKESFVAWKNSQDLSVRTQEIASLLDSNPIMRAMYSELVPSQVSHEVFWDNYFYRVHCESENRDKQKRLLEKVEIATADNDLPGWDEDDPAEGIEIIDPDTLKEHTPTADDSTPSRDVDAVSKGIDFSFHVIKRPYCQR